MVLQVRIRRVNFAASRARITARLVDLFMLDQTLVGHESSATSLADSITEVNVHMPIQQDERLEDFVTDMARELTVLCFKIVSDESVTRFGEFLTVQFYQMLAYFVQSAKNLVAHAAL